MEENEVMCINFEKAIITILGFCIHWKYDSKLKATQKYFHIKTEINFCQETYTKRNSIGHIFLDGNTVLKRRISERVISFLELIVVQHLKTIVSFSILKYRMKICECNSKKNKDYSLCSKWLVRSLNHAKVTNVWVNLIKKAYFNH